MRRTVLALAFLALLAGGVWLVMAPGPPEAAPDAAPDAAPGPIGSTRPGVVGSPSASVAVSSAATSAVPAAAPPVAEPFVQNYAGQPGVKPRKPLPSPTTTHSVRPNVDGCDHNYGEITQCVPWTFPPGTEDKCAWLAARGFKALKVAAEDRQKLDPDGNKIACDN